MRPQPQATGERLVRLSPQLSSGEPEMSSTSTSTCSPHTCSEGRRPRHFRNDIAEADEEVEQRKPVGEAGAALMVAAPTLVYTSGMKLAGAEAECAICLSEFVEGEGIQVLAKCNHGFHVQCIQRWLSSRSSCPTCRCSCLSPPPLSEETTNNSSQSTMPEPEP
ncbi:hypothetical protein V6Z12_D09G208700 [Gossypium hirsutum]